MMSLNSNLHVSLENDICRVLGKFQGVHPLKRLFWELLGYDRRDELIDFPASLSFRSSIIQARLLASHDTFHIYYLTLYTNSLTPASIRQICHYFRSRHRYFAVLVNDVTESQWHFAYFTDDLTAKHPLARLATMALGDSEENLRRQARQLTRLKTYDAENEPISQFELVAAFDEVFIELRSRLKQEKRSFDDFGHLLQLIGRYPLLSAVQERAIFVELDQISNTREVWEGKRSRIIRVPSPEFVGRYEDLRSRIVLHNQRLCFQYAKRFRHTQEDIFDLFQEAVIGLLRAIEMFDIRRNCKFSTYAVQWIKQRIRAYVWDHRSILRLPRHVRDKPEPERPRFSVESLDGGDNCQTLEFEDKSSHVPSFAMEQEDRTHLIDEILLTLPARSRSIVSGRFGLDGSRRKTLKQIGEEHKLTRERVRQLEKRALEKLRDRFYTLDLYNI